jgi:hypothetical protein
MEFDLIIGSELGTEALFLGVLAPWREMFLHALRA